MIDETLAHQYWPNEGPIGQHIHFGADSPWRTIVGIVKHAKSSSLESHTTEGFYSAMAQAPQPAAALVVRTNSPYPAALGVHLFNPLRYRLPGYCWRPPCCSPAIFRRGGQPRSIPWRRCVTNEVLCRVRLDGRSTSLVRPLVSVFERISHPGIAGHLSPCELQWRVRR
jgi:hypothetical protein